MFRRNLRLRSETIGPGFPLVVAAPEEGRK